MPKLSGGRLLADVQSRDADSGLLFKRVIAAINTLGQQIGADPIGYHAPPAPINAINVKGTNSNGVITAPGELLHFTLDHNSEVNKGVHYVTEIANEPSFKSPHIVDHGASRTHTMTLPTYLDDGVTKQNYYVRSYPQYRGSQPQTPTVLGGLINPTPIQMSGTTAATILPSTGSGTAQNNGQQGGWGLGKTVSRDSSDTPRRSL